MSPKMDILMLAQLYEATVSELFKVSRQPFMTGKEQTNRFSRRSLTVRIIILVYIASYNVPNETLLLVDFFFRGGKTCKFSTLYDITIQFE